MMISSNNVASLIGATVTDSDGNKIGSIGQIYVDPNTGRPNWATVKTGLFGTSESFVPLDAADETGGEVRVPYTKDFVKDAPRVDADGALEATEEDGLYSYYHGSPVPEDLSRYATTDADLETPTTDVAQAPKSDDAMTRSEERLHVGTERVESGRARLHKYVVTENQTVTVPVSHEEVRLEREPITDASAGSVADEPEIGEDDAEIILTEERPVVQKETVPVERVSLGTETVTENQQVNEKVRKEEIEYVDGSAPHTEQ